jgi:hypothetical protein
VAAAMTIRLETTANPTLNRMTNHPSQTLSLAPTQHTGKHEQIAQQSKMHA